MTDDTDDIFKLFDKMWDSMAKQAGFSNRGVLPWAGGNRYKQDRNVIRSQKPSKREEIFQNDDNVTIVMELGYGYNKDNVKIDIIERDEKRILQLKTNDGHITRHYILTDDMSGEFGWHIVNGVLELMIHRTPEAIDLGGTKNGPNRNKE
jgi:hypothetical protein